MDPHSNSPKSEREGENSGGQDEGDGEATEELSWSTKLANGFQDEDFETVARIVLAIGASKQADELHRILTQETLSRDGEHFGRLLAAFRINDVPPHHALELYCEVDGWLREQKARTLVWNAVIYALVLADRLDEALDLVREIEAGEDPMLPESDASTYTILARALAGQKGIRRASELIPRMTMRAIEPDAVTCLVMVTSNTRATPPNVERAKFWLRRGEQYVRRYGGKWQRDTLVKNYNSLMSAYSKMGRLSDCFCLLGCMRRRGIKPDQATFQILMHACMKYSSYGTEECRQLLRVMQQMGIEPTTYNYNMLIRGYCNTGQLTSALRVADRMREAGLAWNGYTYYFLIKGVIAAEQVELSLRLLARMRRDGVRPRRNHYTMAFVGLARAGFYDDASRVFRRMASLPNVISEFAFNMMIAIECKRGDLDAASELFENMAEQGFEQNALTFRILLEGHVSYQQWDRALLLEAPLEALRQKLQGVASDPDASEVARMQARVGLEGDRTVRNWSRAYESLVNAALYSGNESIASRLCQRMVEYGLRVDLKKHAPLLREFVSSIRFRTRIERNLWTDESGESREERESWVKQAPNFESGVALGSRAKGGGAPGSGVLQRTGPSARRSEDSEDSDDEVGFMVPPHMFCASFTPDWLEDAESGEDTLDKVEILNLCLRGGSASSAQAYRLVHDYHHAAGNRREMATLRLAPGRSLVCRGIPETPESLQKLFRAYGGPGNPNSSVFLFMRPAAMQLDALLAVLAAAAKWPSDVLLIRGPDDTEELADQCRARGDRLLSYSLSSTIEAMPAAVVVNSQLLITSAGEDLEESTPDDFEGSLSNALGRSFSLQSAAGTRTSSWSRWLQRQDLRQLVRCGPGSVGVRLDGVLHQPAMSKAGLFRVRSLQNSEIAVDLLLEDDDIAAEWR